MANSDRSGKTWKDLLCSVKSCRQKLFRLSSKSPSNFVFRKLNNEIVRLYFLSVPKEASESTILFIDIKYQGGDELLENAYPWCPLLETSFQMMHRVEQYSKEEELLRERKRQVTWGITSYEVDDETGKFVFPTCGTLFSCTDDGNKPSYFPSELKSNFNGIRMNCQICPHNSNLIAYVRNHDLWVQHTESGHEKRLTFAHKGSKSLRDDPLSAAVPSYIIQEEFDRYTGHWWQPCFTNGNEYIYRLLYEEVDDGDVDILHFPVSSEDGTVEEFRFPRAGTANSKSTLKLVEFKLSVQNQIVDVNHLSLYESLETNYSWAEYIVRIGWTPDGQFVWVVLLNRLQTFSQLVLFPLLAFIPTSDSVSMNFNQVSTISPSVVIYEEEANAWLNIHDILYFFPRLSQDEISFIWASEESGFRHLYLITSKLNSNQSHSSCSNKDGVETSNQRPVILSKVALTSGEWEVLSKNVWVDPSRHLVFFESLRDDPLEKHLYLVSIKNPNNIARLTELGYSHSVHVDLNCDMFVTVMSNTTSRPSSYVFSLAFPVDEMVSNVKAVKAFKIATVLKPNAVEELVDSLYPEIFSYTISSNQKLYGMIFKPPNMNPNKKYPTVVIVYGGPEVQLISNTFKGPRQLRPFILASEGYVVVSIDNRGSRHRGVKFETHIKDRLGTVEISDQVEVLELLAKDKNFIDLSRIAIHGWSYGGYLSLMGLAQRPDIFKVAVAGAPVTSWTLYDTGYTERYLGLPSSNPQAYKNGSVLSHVPLLPNEENRLLILHGLIDENVHFMHTSQLINKCLQARKPYQLQVYPEERHSLRHLDASEHFETTLLSFLNQWL